MGGYCGQITHTKIQMGGYCGQTTHMKIRMGGYCGQITHTKIQMDTLVKLPIRKFEWVDTLVKLPQELSDMYIWVHHSAAGVKYPDWVLVVHWSSDDKTPQPVSSRLQIVARSHAPA